MKNVKLFFFLIIFISGCATPSRFVSYDRYGYISKCGFYSHEQLKKEKLYIRKNTNAKIYFMQNGKYEILQENQYEINTADIIPLPIEYCNGEWCKIYYPCGDTEYFVKKDDIEQYKTWGHKK